MNAPAPPMTAKGRATRDRLLRAARQIVIDSGGHIEIAQLAAAAGVVPSLVHRYFGSKSGLVNALVDDFYDGLHAAVFAVRFEGKDWAERERRRLEAGVRFHLDEPLAVVVYGQLARDPAVARREAERVAGIVSLGARSVRKGQRAGELPVGVDPGLAAAAMFGAMRQVMVEALCRARRPSPERVIEALWRQVAASVALDPTATPVSAF